MDFDVQIDTRSEVNTLSLGTALDFIEYEMDDEQFEFFLKSVERFIDRQTDRYIKRKEEGFFFKETLKRE